MYKLASVYPLRRLPRSLNSFTYGVNERDFSRIKVGQLLRVPFRGSIVFGIFENLTNCEIVPRTIKYIDSIVNEEPIFGSAHLGFIKTMSSWYGVSEAAVAVMSAPPLLKRKLDSLELSPLPAKSDPRLKNAIEYKQYSTKEDHSELLKKALISQTLILVPEAHLLYEVYNLLPPLVRDNAVIWHSGLTNKEKFLIWTAVRNNQAKTIIGLRGAIFLPFFSLDTIVVDYEHGENHKHWGEAPRFHAKDAAILLQQLYGAELIFASFSPSVQAYFSVHKKLFFGSLDVPKADHEHVRLVNMGDERKAKNFGLLAEAVAGAIRHAKGDVFVHMTRRGFATSVGCPDCGFVARCKICGLALVYHELDKTLRCHSCGMSRPMFLDCQKCHSTLVQLRGAGTELAETAIRKLLGSKSAHAVVRIDGDTQDSVPDGLPMVLVGTDKAMPFVRWEKTEAVYLLDIDRALTIPEFSAGEDAWHRVHEILFRKQTGTVIYIQTTRPEQLFLRSLFEPDRWYRTELNARRSIEYPPYSYMVRAFFGHENAQIAETEASRLHGVLTRYLTEADIRGKLIHPLPMHPPYYRKKFWYTVSIRLYSEKWQSDLPGLVSQIPGSWKIDPNPISLLSP